MKRHHQLLMLGILIFLISGFSKKEPVTPYPFPKLFLFPKMPFNPDNTVSKEGAMLGRYLFYDTILSANYDMSCASCHKQEYAFSDSPNQFSNGNSNYITRRNTLPLFNLAWYPSYFWDGRAASIEEQIFHPVSDSTELNLDWKTAAKRIQNSDFYRPQFELVFGKTKIDSVLIAKAIAQFLRTLLSYQSKFDMALIGKDTLTDQEHYGFGLLSDQTKGNCLHCHPTDGSVLGTTTRFSNNGIDMYWKPEFFIDKGLGGITNKITDIGKFKIPSLRNVALTAPYMHDGRFQTLEEVIKFYSEGVNLSANIDPKMTNAHNGGMCLSETDQQAIIAFLYTLTDSVFITNPEFSNPFK